MVTTERGVTKRIRHPRRLRFSVATYALLVQYASAHGAAHGGDMNARYVVVGTVVAAVVLFVWSSVMHVGLWPESSVKTFKDEGAVNDVIRANGSGNGLYINKAGVVAVVHIDPNVPNTFQNMGPMLTGEFISDLVVGLLLAIGFGLVGIGSARNGAAAGVVFGLAAATHTYASETIWYGYPWLFTILNSIEIVVGWMLAGAVLGVLAVKMNRSQIARTVTA
jgi:hypothetical protein